MDVSYLIGGAAWLAVLGYFGWRIWSCQRRLIPVSREITWAVYLLTVPLWVLFPNLSRAASAVVFVVWLVVSGYISYQLNYRFNAWVEEEKKKKKEEREEF